MPLFANGTQEQDAEDDQVELEFQIWVTPNLTVEYWEDLVTNFNKEYPNIKVNLVQATTGDSVADNFLKTRLAAGDFPDVINVFTKEIFIDAGAIMSLPIDEDVRQLRNLEGMLIDGKLWAYDAITLIHGLIYYNKTMFADAGITEVPKTQAEMDVVCEKLVAAGYTPFMMAGADWTAGFEFSIWAAPDVFYQNQQWYKDKNEGKVTFAEDFYYSAERFKDYVEKGYIFKGALGTDYPTGQQLFLEKKAAMYPMGSWFSGSPEAQAVDFEIGAFAPVTQDGGSYLAAPANRSGFGVSATSKHPEEAILLAKYMGLSVYPVKARLVLEGGFPDMKNGADYMYEMNSIQQEIYEVYQNTDIMTNNLNHPVGAAPPAGFADSMTQAAQELLIGGTVEDAMVILDEFWDENK